MRSFIAISIVVASVSSAAAQFHMDHGSTAQAAADARQAQIDSILSASRRAMLQQRYNQQKNLESGNRSGNTIKLEARTEEEMKADEAAQAAWNARCKPTVVEDREGLRRVKYAERDCDLSRFNTAGN